MSEKWRPVSGYRGLYEVSNEGRVRSIDRAVLVEGKFKRRIKGRLLKITGYTKTKYKKVVLSKNGKAENCLLHRVVATAFVPNEENKKEVNHIDYNQENNKAGNLEWVTRGENRDHNIKGDRYFKGENNKAAKLTSKKVEFIKNNLQLKVKDLAEMFNVTPSTIVHVKKGRSWKHLYTKQEGER